MTQAMPSKPEADTALGELIAATLLHEGELWMNTQKELLADAAALTESWLQLYRAALDAFSRALHTSYSDPAASFLLQRGWMSPYWDWAAAIERTGADGGVHAVQKAAIRLHEPVEAGRAEILVRRSPAKNAVERAPAAE